MLTYRRAVESSERLATQLAISHLPRVDERVMAVMWLLAEVWGHVTPSGIRLRLALTHDALGELVGAQRSTSGGRLALLEAELARVRDKYAPGRGLAQDLADNARQLRARTHELVFDAHLLTDIKHQERTATAFATDPRRARLAGRGEKEGRAT